MVYDVELSDHTILWIFLDNIWFVLFECLVRVRGLKFKKFLKSFIKVLYIEPLMLVDPVDMLDYDLIVVLFEVHKNILQICIEPWRFYQKHSSIIWFLFDSYYILSDWVYNTCYGLFS